MRKGRKIKAGFLIIAWMMIFAHDVIPHNHVDMDHRVLADLIHPSHFLDDSVVCTQYRELCEDFTSCRFSELLFQKFNAENNIILPENRIFINVIYQSGSFLNKEIKSLPTGISQNPVSFRAPPAIC